MYRIYKKFIKFVKLSREAYVDYKRHLLVLVVLSLAGGLFEAIGINILIPIISLLTKTEDGATDKISEFVNSIFLSLNLEPNLPILLVSVLVLFMFKTVVLYFSSIIIFKIIADYEMSLRSKIFGLNMQAKWNFLMKQKLGYLQNMLVREVGYATAMLRGLSDAITTLMMVSMYIIIAFSISFQITASILIIGLFLFYFSKPLLYRTREIAKKNAEAYKDTSHFVEENVLGMKTHKAMNTLNRVLILGQDNFERLKNYRIKSLTYKYISTAFIQPISLFIIVGVLGIYYLMGEFHFASVMVVLYLIQKIFASLQQVQKGIYNLTGVSPYVENIMRYQKEAALHADKSKGTRKFAFSDTLRFENVSFSYDNISVFENLDLAVKKGEMVGLIGPSGVGKTTLVDLLLQLFSPTKGSISLDGINISDIKIEQWRNSIGYVSQDFFLINDTIENNIKFFDDSIAHKDVVEATKMVDLYDFIQELPDTFDSNVGDRGSFLSVGQRQRIVLARILARKPEILVLDEATSALDNKSEKQIKKILERLRGKITIIIIAHRLSTVMSCDRIMALGNKKVVETGSPEELLRDKESYFYKTYTIDNT